MISFIMTIYNHIILLLFLFILLEFIFRRDYIKIDIYFIQTLKLAVKF